MPLLIAVGIVAGGLGIYSWASTPVLEMGYNMLVASCGACSLVGNLYVITTTLGAQVFHAISPDLLKLGYIIFGIWMLMQIGKIVNPFSGGEQGVRIMQEIFTRGLYMLFILFFLHVPSVSVGAGGQTADPFYDWILRPVRDAGIGVATKIMSTAEAQLANGGNFATAKPVSGTHLAKDAAGCGAFQAMAMVTSGGIGSASPGTLTKLDDKDKGVQDLICVIEKVQNTVAVGIMLGVRMASVDLKQIVNVAFSGANDIGTLLLQVVSGLFLIIAYVFLLVRIVFALVDVVWRWAIAWLIAPFCLFAFAMPQTASYGIKLIKLIVQAAVMLVMLAFGIAVVAVMLSYIPQMMSDPAKGISLKTLDDVFNAFKAESGKSVILTVFDARFVYLIIIAWVGQALVGRAGPMSEALVDWRDAGDIGAELYGRSRGTAASVVGGVVGAGASAAGAAVTRGAGMASGGAAAIKSMFRR